MKIPLANEIDPTWSILKGKHPTPSLPQTCAVIGGGDTAMEEALQERQRR